MASATFSDVEGTLIDGSLPDIFFDKAAKLGVLSPLKIVIVNFVRTVGKLLPNKLSRQLKMYLILLTMRGVPESQIEQVASELAEALMPHCKALTLNRLRELQAQGQTVILISAGFHNIIAAFAEKLNMRGEGTKMEVKNGRYTGKLDGVVCQGEGKAARARAVITELKVETASSSAFGDTANDIPFLKLFGQVSVVDPDKKLADEATRQGWAILRS